MFQREFEAIAALDHPSIIDLFDYGIHEGVEFLAMEYFPCGDLKARLQNPLTAGRSHRLPQGNRALAQGGARGRHHPPRPQAAERHAARRRQRGAHRLRPGAQPAVRRRQHAHRRAARLALLHESRTGAGRGAGRAHRPVQPRRDPLRDAGRQEALPRRLGHRRTAAARHGAGARAAARSTWPISPCSSASCPSRASSASPPATNCWPRSNRCARHDDSGIIDPATLVSAGGGKLRPHGIRQLPDRRPGRGADLPDRHHHLSRSPSAAASARATSSWWWRARRPTPCSSCRRPACCSSIANTSSWARPPRRRPSC